MYQIFSEVQINEAYSLMLSKTESELDNLANSYEKEDAFEGAYKMIAAAWSSNRKSSKFRKRFRLAQFRYNSGQVIDNSFFEYIKTKSVNDETLNKWEICKEKELETRVRLKELDVKKGGFVKEIIGDESGLFTFVINKIPQEGHPSEVKLISVTKTNIEFIGSYRLKVGETIGSYTGISQSMRLINPNEKATLVVTLDNYNPISHEFTKNALSNFPIGSLITSVLDFNQFSRETKNNPDGYFDPKTSKWAPADGRLVKGSEYQRSYNDKLPDFRGQFIRGLNQFYSSDEPANFENGNDGGKRIASNKYSYQEQSTKIPTKPFINSGVGNHQHPYQDIYWMEAWGNTTVVTGIGDSGGDGDNKGYQIGRTTGAKGAHNHNITGGDAETRPKNVGVYFYIRINK